jgi:hypothetical protein
MRRRPLISLLAAAKFAAAGTMALPAHSAEAGWTIVPTPVPVGPTESLLRSVSCVSAQACMAVGFTDDGHPAVNGEAVAIGSLAESWNGSSWTQVPTPASAGANPELYTVSCASAAFCVAVGHTGTNAVTNATVFDDYAEPGSRAIVETWNGTAWTVQPNPAAALPASTLGGVSCRSDSFCIAVGASRAQARERALAEVWNGTSWKLQTPPRIAGQGAHLQAVSCVPGSCQAVGFYLPRPEDPLLLAERWDGSRWSVDPPGNNLAPEPNGVSCVSRSFCLAVGAGGPSAGPTVAPPFAERWNGSRWTLVTSGLPKHGPLYGVSCVTSAFCLAVGQFDDQPGPLSGTAGPLLESWNGSRWSRSTTPAVPAPQLSPEDPFPDPLDPALLGISCVAQIGCTAIGAQAAGSNLVPLAQSEVGAPSAPPPEPAPAPAPVLGRSADVMTVSGTVLERLPGNHAFAPLSSSTQIPFGTVVDATHGSVSVTTAGPHGTTQTITLSEGEFVLTQGHNGAVLATLAGGDFSVCPTASERAHIARSASTHTTGKHVVRKLWAEGHGNFTTDGNYASASVRGTRWLTEDLCEGTLIHVATDRVAVVNRVNHSHVTVKAGHSYLAKAP